MNCCSSPHPPFPRPPGLLPRIISGSSGGSITAGFLAIHTDVEMKARILHPGVAHLCGKKCVAVPLWFAVFSGLHT